MIIKTCKNTSKLKKCLRCVLPALLIAAVISICIPYGRAKADYVTDWLEVRVGYSGMELSEYVLVDRFHFSDFESGEIVPLNLVSYSYFQGDGQTDDEGVYHNSEYRSIVATGWGFYIKDLLNYCRIYYGDIYNILFYVNDHETIWTALDKDSLFRQRFYFNDLPGHREIIYNDFMNPVAYDFSACWEDCWEVEPMLALESNWDSVNEKIEHHIVYEDEALLSTSTRFRLLYGQISPTEHITRESAEYVSCVYVTLNGKAEYGEMPELSSEIGSHTVEMQVSTDSTAIRDALSELMQLNSSNEEVLRIKGYTIVASDVYSDIATIVIDYEILTEGEASISASLGRGNKAVTETVASIPEEKQTDPQEEEVTQPQDQQPGQEETASGDERPQEEGSGTQKEGSGTQQDPDGSRQEETAGAQEEIINETPEYTENNIQETEKARPDAAVEEEPVPEEIEAVTAEAAQILPAGSVFIYRLADGIMTDNINEVINSQISAPPDRDITQLLVEDDTEEKNEQERLILLLTGAGALVICGAGFLAGLSGYRLRLKYKNGLPDLSPVKHALNRFFFGIEYREDK